MKLGINQNNKNLIINEISNGNFNASQIAFANEVFRKSIKFTKHPDESNLRKRLIKTYTETNKTKRESFRLNYAFMIYVVEVLMGNFTKSREDFLERVVNLNTNTFLDSANHLEHFKTIIKDIFNREELVSLFQKVIFKGSFWNKDLDTKKSNFLWVFPVFWVIYGFETDFKELYNCWLKIFDRAIKKDNIELVFFMHLPLSHIYLNLAQTQEEFRKFNEDVEIPFSKYLQEKVIPKFKIKTNLNEKKSENEPKKIAFVYDRIVGSSPVKLLCALLKNLVQKNENCEYYVYDIEVIEKSPSDQNYIKMIESLGVKYFSNHRLLNYSGPEHYYSHFEKCMVLRDSIIKEGIDILIMGNNREQFNFLFTTRTAPKQIFWCHGNFEYDVPEIDKRITHIGTDLNKSHYEFMWFALNESNFHKKIYRLSAEEEQIVKTYREKFEKNIIFGNIGRIVKLESEIFIKNLAKIMGKYENSIFFACGGAKTEKLKKLLIKYGLNEKFFFPGFVKNEVFSQVIDVFIDTYPNLSGNAIQEYILNQKRALFVKNSTPVIFGEKDEYSDDRFENYFNFTAEFETDFIFYNNDKIKEIKDYLSHKYPKKTVVTILSQKISGIVKKVIAEESLKEHLVFLIRQTENEIKDILLNMGAVVETTKEQSINMLHRICDIVIVDDFTIGKHNLPYNYYVNRMFLIKGIYNSVSTQKSFFEFIAEKDEKFLKKLFKIENWTNTRIRGKDVFGDAIDNDMIFNLIHEKRYDELKYFELRNVLFNKDFRKKMFYLFKRLVILLLQENYDNFFYYSNRRCVEKRASQISIGELIE